MDKLIMSRRAAALALLGWYLLLPVPGSDWSSDGNLSHLAHIASFAAAADCENAKTDLQKKYGNHGHQTFRNQRNLLIDSTVCIADDDPRLKPK